MGYNYNKLAGKIKEIFKTQAKFAEVLGMNRSSLSQRLNCKTEFSQSEINKAIKVLGLNEMDISEYFFNSKV